MQIEFVSEQRARPTHHLDEGFARRTHLGLLYPLRGSVHFGGDRRVRGSAALRLHPNLPRKFRFAGADRDPVFHSAFVHLGAAVADPNAEAALGVQAAGDGGPGDGALGALHTTGDGRAAGRCEPGLCERAATHRRPRQNVHHIGDELEKSYNVGDTEGNDGEEAESWPWY